LKTATALEDMRSNLAKLEAANDTQLLAADVTVATRVQRLEAHAAQYRPSLAEVWRVPCSAHVVSLCAKDAFARFDACNLRVADLAMGVTR